MNPREARKVKKMCSQLYDILYATTRMTGKLPPKNRLHFAISMVMEWYGIEQFSDTYEYALARLKQCAETVVDGQLKNFAEEVA